MKYVLDFDGTLFDTERFKRDAKKYLKRGELLDPAIWDTFDAPSYLYEDVIPFLERILKDNACIVSAYRQGGMAFQKAKIERSGIGSFVADIVLVEGLKGDTLAQMAQNSDTVFIDDKLVQVESVHKACPFVSVMQIMRPNHVGESEPQHTDPTIKKITSLYEIIN